MDTIDSNANNNVDTIATKHNSSTVWIITGLAIALIVVFIIITIAFFIIGNKSPMNEIAVVNNCGEPINIIIGSTGQNNTINSRINPKQTLYYYATPGSNMTVQGYYDDTVLPDNNTPFTKALIWFANINNNGPYQITDNNIIINASNNNNNEDMYDVSLQDGFNIEISITSNCQKSISWNYDINKHCPQELTLSGVCMSPCYAGLTGYCTQCGDQWSDPDYYALFYNACPTCMITTCDNPQFSCNNNISQYIISFCPNS